ncbi:hypothetical protein [Candidatus Chloroploca sp. Khr17]|uniref:hypothetical protein n=1 Tax=Candidatus Chloroploca sp. Khr17 TaxID=2496869 RepID=UPI00101D63B5|nr:hypothetical protein [Candidatus Chloroploca sp. Khr17]
MADGTPSDEIDDTNSPTRLTSSVVGSFLQWLGKFLALPQLQGVGVILSILLLIFGNEIGRVLTVLVLIFVVLQWFYQNGRLSEVARLLLASVIGNVIWLKNNFFSILHRVLKTLIVDSYIFIGRKIGNPPIYILVLLLLGWVLYYLSQILTEDNLRPITSAIQMWFDVTFWPIFEAYSSTVRNDTDLQIIRSLSNVIILFIVLFFLLLVRAIGVTNELSLLTKKFESIAVSLNWDEIIREQEAKLLMQAQLEWFQYVEKQNALDKLFLEDCLPVAAHKKVIYIGYTTERIAFPFSDPLVRPRIFSEDWSSGYSFIRMTPAQFHEALEEFIDNVKTDE